MNKEFITRLKEFISNEARSCSMVFGRVTPQYVYRGKGTGTCFTEKLSQ